MNDLFNFKIKQPSAEFVALRDDPHNTQYKKISQDLWRVFSPWADPTFPKQFALKVHQRFWEMYLGVQLIERGFQLIPKQSSFGPDFHILLDGKHLWIEATAAEEGSGNDAVSSIMDHDRFEPVPEDQIILRFTNAISEKTKKREEYIKKGVIGSEDAFIIALNGGGIGMITFEGSLPNIIRAVYPIGNYVVTFDKETGEVIREGYQTRYQIHKYSKASVPTNAFLDQNYSGVSGILYSNAALWHMPTIPGGELLYIDNFAANVHLQNDWLGIGKYCFKEEEHLTIINQ